MTDRFWQRTMPYGLHKGSAIDAPPEDCLACLTTIELWGWLHDAVHREFDHRTDHRAPAPVIRIQWEELPLVRRLFEAGYQALVKKTHPDVGGDLRQMQALNAIVKSVRDQIEALEAAK